MKNFLILILAAFLLVNCNQTKQSKQLSLASSENSTKKQPVVVQFIIDGLMKDAAETAIEAGAENLEYFAKNRVFNS